MSRSRKTLSSRTRIARADEEADWARRRAERFDDLSTRLNMPREEILALAQTYHEILGANHDQRRFVREFLGLNQEDCMSMPMIAKELQTDFENIEARQELMVEHLMQLKTMKGL